MTKREKLLAAFERYPEETRRVKLPSLLRALELAELKEQHRQAYARHCLNPDAEDWDQWLETIGNAALELGESYQARLDCEAGTAMPGCVCYGCRLREFYETSSELEGSARGGRVIVSRFTQSDCLRRGLELHNAWTFGLKRKRSEPRPAPNVVLRHGPINWREWRRGYQFKPVATQPIELEEAST